MEDPERELRACDARVGRLGVIARCAGVIRLDAQAVVEARCELVRRRRIALASALLEGLELLLEGQLIPGEARVQCVVRGAAAREERGQQRGAEKSLANHAPFLPARVQASSA